MERCNHCTAEVDADAAYSFLHCLLMRSLSGCLQLLAKAGYKGTGGLGPQESGITSPIPAWHNQGRLGIGSGPTQQPASSSHTASRAGNLSVKEISHGSGEGPDASRAASQQQQQQQHKKRSKPPHKDWGSVTVEENLQVFIDAALLT